MKYISIVAVIVMLALTTTGCSLYSVDKNIELSNTTLSSQLNTNDETGKTKIFIYNTKWWKFAANDSNLFFIKHNEYSDSRFTSLYGINTKLEDTCYKGTAEWCFKQFLSKYKAKEVKIEPSGAVYGENIYLQVYHNRDDSDIYVEYIDKTKNMLASYSKLSGNANDEIDFIKNYKESKQAQTLLEGMFKKYYSVSIAKSYESPQRTKTSKGVASSSAGTCKDIIREIEIKPKYANQVPPMDFKVDVSYKLTRNYEPYSLEKDGDPLYKNSTFNLSSSNNYTAKDKVEFNCVLTSGRFHSAALSFFGGLVGNKKTGIETTLKSYNFDMDIKKVSF